MTTESMNTLSKVKDALLVGLMGIITLVALKTMADVADIKVNLAGYQADAKTQKERVDRLERLVFEAKR